MKDKELLSKAISIAIRAHSGFYDKGGNPYILHPLYVMSKCKTNDEKIVGILHDVVEDTDVSIDDLRGFGFSDDIIAAIDAITRRDNEMYSLYISRVMSNDLATIVKIYDLEHNMDTSRLGREITDSDRSLLKRYKTTKSKLESNIRLIK